MLGIRLLGELTVEVDGRTVELPGGRTRSLFGWLALHRGSHRRSEVAALFWPDILDASARASLRTAVWALRRTLGPTAETALIATRDRIGIAGGPSVWTDISAFAELVDAGKLEDALELCRGDLLSGLDDDWVFEARSEHADRVVETLGRLAARAEAGGDLQGALGWTRRQVVIDPLAEDVQRELIRRLAAAGDRVRAVESYERLRERLRTELGLAPSSATRELVRSLRIEDGAGETRPAGADPTVGKVVAPPPPGEGSEGTWEPGLPFPLPSGLASELEGPFVGRAAELEWLRGAVAEIRDKHGPRFVFLSGDAGIGKTRLVAELAREAADQGTIVLYGVAEKEALLPYQPFVAALRHYVAIATPTELSEHVGALRRELACLLPDLGERIPSLGTPDEAATEVELHRALDAVISLLARLSEQTPCLLVLDDLQWVGRSSALLLRHLVASRRGAQLLIIGSSREDELQRSGPVAEAIGELGGSRFLARLSLAGLDPTEVEELCREWAGTSELSASIHAETEGNPFFVKEMLRHLDESGTERSKGRLGLPTGVRELIECRLARLSDESARALTISAVIGRDFELRVLERVSTLDGDQLAEALEEAVGLGLLREVPDAFERFRFSHALIRETLLDRLTRTRRARIHARVADTLEELDEQGGAALPTLAYHWCEAGRAGDPDKAIELATRAATQASLRYAYGEAVELYSWALRLVPDEDTRRRTILIRRGVAYMKLEHFVMAQHGVGVGAGAGRQPSTPRSGEQSAAPPASSPGGQVTTSSGVTSSAIS